MFVCNRKALVLQLSLLFIAAALHAQAPPPQTTITGRVVAEATGQPVRRAYVIVHGPETKTTRVTMSDGEGRFTFEGLPSDRYRVGAEKRPLLSAVTELTGADLVISLPAGAVVTGQVTDQLGRPVDDVTVNVSGPALGSPQTARTNLRGEFRVHSLPPGAYVIGPVSHKGEGRSFAVAGGEQVQLPALTLDSSDTQPVAGSDGTEGTGVIGGLALDALNDQPLAGVTIALQRSMRTAITDARGRFEFRGLGATTYGFRIQQPGYASVSRAEVPLTADARVHDVVVKGGRHGSIAGTIRDDGGDALVGIDVRAFRKTSLGVRPVLRPSGNNTTDDRGAFHIESLPAGDYVVCACGTESLPVSPGLLRKLGPSAPDTATMARLLNDAVPAFAPTYFPGVSRGVDSLVVTIGLGDDRQGMDISLTPVRRFSIRGQILEAGGAPTQPMQLHLTQDGDLPGGVGLSEVKPVRLEPDGRFLFVGVPPGTYGIGAIPVKQNQTGPWAFTDVVVVDRDVDHVLLPLGSGITIDGRMEFSGSATRPTRAALTKARVSLVPLDFSARLFTSMVTSGRVGHSGAVDEEGRFLIEGVAEGRYLVRASVDGSPWQTVQRVSSGRADIVDDVLALGPEGASNVVVVVSDAPLAVLRGTAELQRYDPVTATQAVVFPSDPVKWLDPARFASQFLWQRVSPDRSFVIPNLPAGDYFVVVEPDFDLEMSPSRFEHWSKTAQRVTLKAGETTTVNIGR